MSGEEIPDREESGPNPPIEPMEEAGNTPPGPKAGIKRKTRDSPTTDETQDKGRDKEPDLENICHMIKLIGDQTWKLNDQYKNQIKILIKNLGKQKDLPPNTKTIVDQLEIRTKELEPIIKEITTKSAVTNLIEEYISKKENKDQETQTEYTSRKSEKIERIRKSMKEAKTPEELDEITKENWPNDTYEKTSTTTETILKPRRTRFLMIEERSEADKYTIEALAYQYPRLKTFKEAPPGQKTTMIVTTENEDPQKQDQKIENILIVGKIKEKPTPQETLDLLKAMEQAGKQYPRKNPLEEDPGKEENIPMIMFPADIDLRMARKITEIGTTYQQIRISHKMTKREARSEATARRIEMNDRKNTIIITPLEGETCTEVIRNLKKDFTPSELGIDIENITQTANGEIKIRIREDREGAREDFISKLREQRDPVVMPFQVTTKMIVKGLEPSTTKEEVEEALKNIITGPTQKVIRTETPRTSELGKTTAMIYVDKSDVAEIERARIPIGWAKCKAERYIAVPICQNCQSIGHEARACQIQRFHGKICHRCAEIGHTMTSCQERPNCYNCGGPHPATSMECPIYRSVFRQIKNSIITGRKENNRTRNKPTDETDRMPLAEPDSPYQRYQHGP